VSGFATVDDDTVPSSLIRFLDDAAAWESGMKHYVARRVRIAPVAGPILDSAVAPATTWRCLPASGSEQSASTPAQLFWTRRGTVRRTDRGRAGVPRGAQNRSALPLPAF
jgi:hypothetical protein